MPIREVFRDEAATIARIIAESNRDVAARFGLTAENCAKHPSLCTPQWIEADLARGERYFVFVDAGTPVACVAYETADAQLAYLNRLSVLPAYRRRGIGAALVAHVIGLARVGNPGRQHRRHRRTRRPAALVPRAGVRRRRDEALSAPAVLRKVHAPRGPGRRRPGGV